MSKAAIVRVTLSSETDDAFSFIIPSAAKITSRSRRKARRY